MKCPNCGYCPACGRKDAAPYNPGWQPYPWTAPYTYPWWQHGGSITIKSSDTTIANSPYVGTSTVKFPA